MGCRWCWSRNKRDWWLVIRDLWRKNSRSAVYGGNPTEEAVLCLQELRLRRRGRFFGGLGGSGLLSCQLLQ